MGERAAVGGHARLVGAGMAKEAGWGWGERGRGAAKHKLP